MRNQALALQREEKIRARFTELRNERRLLVEAIIAQLASEFDYEHRTIQAILYGEYDRARARRTTVKKTK